MRLIILIITVFLLVSCKKDDFIKSYTDTEGFKVLNIHDNNLVSKFNMSEFIDKIEYIQLETKPESTIGSVTKLYIDSNYIYVLDWKISKKLFIFQKNGKFLKTLSRQGKGPGEYSTITDFKVLKDNKLLLYDYSGMKLMYFDNLQYSHSEKIDFYNKSVVKIGSLCFFNPERGKYSNIINENKNHDLLISDSNGKVIRKYLPYNEKSDVLYRLRYPFREYMDSLTYVDALNSRVYRIKGTTLFPKYFLDFGKYQFPYEKTISNDDFNENFTKYGHVLDDFYENEKYIFFSVIYDDSTATFCLLNKENNILKLSKKLVNDIDNLHSLNLFSNYNNLIFGTISAEDIIRTKSFKKEKYGLGNVNDLDNPIIAVYSFKS